MFRLHNLAFRFKLCVKSDWDDIRGSKMWSAKTKPTTKQNKIMWKTVSSRHTISCAIVQLRLCEREASQHIISVRQSKSKNENKVSANFCSPKRSVENPARWLKNLKCSISLFRSLFLVDDSERTPHSRYHLESIYMWCLFEEKCTSKTAIVMSWCWN